VNELCNFLYGHVISIGGGYFGSVNWAISPANSGTKNALGLGFILHRSEYAIIIYLIKNRT
jgi:hypothetical protein